MNQNYKSMVRTAVARMRDLDDEISRVSKLIGIIPESPLYEKINSLNDSTITLCSTLCGDKWEWVDWYCRETNYGRNPQNVSFGDDEPFKVRSIDQLFRVIERHKLQKDKKEDE